MNLHKILHQMGLVVKNSVGRNPRGVILGKLLFMCAQEGILYFFKWESMAHNPVITLTVRN